MRSQRPNHHSILIILTQHPLKGHDRVCSVQCNACEATRPPGNGETTVCARKERNNCIPRVVGPVVGMPAMRRRMPATSKGRQKKRVLFGWHCRCVQTVRRHISGTGEEEKSPNVVEKSCKAVVVPCARHYATLRCKHCFLINPC